MCLPLQIIYGGGIDSGVELFHPFEFEVGGGLVFWGGAPVYIGGFN